MRFRPRLLRTTSPHSGGLRHAGSLASSRVVERIKTQPLAVAYHRLRTPVIACLVCLASAPPSCAHHYDRIDPNMIRMNGTVRHLDELGLDLARHLAGLAHLKREARHNAVEPIRNRRDAAVAVVGRAPATAPTASRPPHRPFATASRRDRERLVRLGPRVMKKKIERCRHEYVMRTTAAGAAATRDSGERRRR